MKLYNLTKKKPVKASAILVAIIGGVVIITGVLGLLGIINPNSDAFFYTFIIPTLCVFVFRGHSAYFRKEHTRETSKIRDFLLGVVEALDPETIEDLAVKNEPMTAYEVEAWKALVKQFLSVLEAEISTLKEMLKEPNTGIDKISQEIHIIKTCADLLPIP